MTRYDLTSDEMQRLSRERLDRHPLPDGRFVLFTLAPEEPLADVARSIECETFLASFGNDADELSAEYAPYEKASRFLLVVDQRRGEPAGCARVIEGTGAGTKTLDDAPALVGRTYEEIAAAHGLNGEKVWDYATVAVRPAYRGRRSALAVSSLLYRAVLVQGIREGVKHLTAMLDRGVYRNMKLLGTPFVTLAGSGPFEYLGSAENRAVYADFPSCGPAITTQAERLRQASRPTLDDLRQSGPRRLIRRWVAADVSHRVATGAGLDANIIDAVPAADGA